MINTKRFTALCLSAAMFVSSIMGGTAWAAQETSNPEAGQQGYVALQQYVQPTSDPNIFKVMLTLQAPMDPKPADVMIVLDASSSMEAGMGGSGNPSRWAGAIAGANAAIEVFTNPDKNPAADKTRVGVGIYNAAADDIVTLTSDKAQINRGMATLDGMFSLTGDQNIPATRPNLNTSPIGVGGTDLYLGVDLAYGQFNGKPAVKKSGGVNAWLPDPKKSEPDARKYVIYLSDGANSVRDTNPAYGDASAALDLATGMKVTENVTFMSIGLGVTPLAEEVGQPSSLTPAYNSNYANWNTKASVDYKSMISPYITGPFSNTIFGYDVPLTLNQTSTGPGVFSPNALLNTSAQNANYALGGGSQNTNYLASSNKNVWNGTEGYIDIPGDQYFQPDPATNLSVGDGPQSLIYMAQMLSNQSLSNRNIVVSVSAAGGTQNQSSGNTSNGPLSAITTWDTSSPLTWGFEPMSGAGSEQAVKLSSFNTGSFYWDNWISNQVIDLLVGPGFLPPGGPAPSGGIFAPADYIAYGGYNALPASGFAIYGMDGGAPSWITGIAQAVPEAPVYQSIGDVYNADTVLRNTKGEIVEPYFRSAQTLGQVVDAFEEFANKIIRFGEDVKVTINTNSNWEIVDRYGNMPDWYSLENAFEGSTVTRSGNNISWDPVAIPMIGQSVLTYYVRFTGNQTDGNMYYPVIDSCQLSFVDNYDPQNLTERVKNFPQALVNPRTNEVKQSNVVLMNDVANSGTPNTISATGNVFNDITGSGNVTAVSSSDGSQGTGGGIAFLGAGPQPYKASVANTAATKKTTKKTTTDTSNVPETLSDSAYKEVKGKSLKTSSSKVPVYHEPMKNAKVDLYLTKGKTFKIAGATEKYYMIQYKKKDGKVQKGYILKTDVSLVK